MEKVNHSYIAGGNTEWYSHSGKQLKFCLKLKMDIFDPAVVLLGTYYTEMKMYLPVEIHTSHK